jgi:tetratricopeptide (TPR) repeat protein
VALAVYTALLCVSTYRYTQIWKDDITLWNAVIANEPFSGLPYYNRGTTLLSMKQYDRAIADFSKAVEINPRYAEAYQNRGAARKDLKDYDAAIADFKRAIAINPTYGDAYVNLGNTLVSAGRLAEAVDIYSRAIALGGDRARVSDLHVKRGIASYGVDDHQGACRDWRQANELGHRGAPELIAEYCR